MPPREGASRIPFRVRIGVTGHRAFADPERVAQRVQAILERGYREAFTPEARAALDAATATPIVFTAVSPLAEGADRIVARSVLARPGGLLEVLLPSPREEYERSFASEASRAEFADLLRGAHRAHVVGRAASPEAGGGDETRSESYRRVGERVVERCDILVAVWDGDPSRGTGGTAEIAQLAMEARKPVFIVSTHGPEHDEVRNAGTLTARNLAALEQFNAAPISEGAISAKVDETVAELHGDHAGSLPPDWRSTVVDRIAPPYARASLIADRAQSRYVRTGRRAYTLSTLAVAAMAVAVVFSAYHAVSIVACVVELAILSTLLFEIHRAHRDRVHAAWLDNRLLAERLRTAFFLVSCGRLPGAAAERPAGLLLTESRAWVEAAVAEIVGAVPRAAPPGDGASAVLSGFVRVRWLDHQIEYHRRKEASSERANRRLKAVGVSCFAAAIAMSLLHLGLSWLALRTHAAGSLALALEHLLSVVAVTLPAAGAAMNGYRTLLELSRQARRSRAMAVELEAVRRGLPERPDRASLDACLGTIERLMGDEAQGWVQVMSFSDLSSIA